MDTRITGLSFAPKLLAASQSFVALPAPAQTPAPADQVVLSQPQTQPAPPAPQPPAPQPQQPAPQQPGGPNSGPAPAPPVLTGDGLQHPGVPVGKLSEKLTLHSQIYDGMLSDYWIYVPAQYDPKKPAAVMVFQDGSGYIDRKGDHPALNVLDNLIAQCKIPVIIAIFTNPGDISASPGTPT